MKPPFEVEITDPTELHCFRLTIHLPPQPQPGAPDRIEIMMHAMSLVGLINECSLALCEWQRSTSEDLLRRITGWSDEELRDKGLIAPRARVGRT
jgi:hypothetical protein